MRRVIFYAVALFVALAAITIAPSGGVASAAGVTDTKYGPASVGPIDFGCQGSLTFIGFTADGYHAEKVGGHTFYGLHAQFHGTSNEVLGPTVATPSGSKHTLDIAGDGVLGAPSGHDSTGDYFDFHFRGRVSGPVVNQTVDGTWRVWVKRDHIVTDAIISLSTDGGIVSLSGVQC